MPCPCPGGQKACCPQNNTFDSLTVINGLRVLRGPTTLCGETEVEKLCFKDKSGDGQKWCAQENGATDQLCITKGNTGKQVCVLPDSGAVKTTGFFADATEVISVLQSPSLVKGTTIVSDAFGASGFGTLGSGVDGQIKRIQAVTSDIEYVLHVPNLTSGLGLTTPLLLGSKTLLSENFDSVTPPALPNGWTADNNVGPDPKWVTTNVDSDSTPNNLFVDAPAEVSDKYVSTPDISVPLNSNLAPFPYKFQFSNNFNFESSSTANFDGGVLELSFDFLNWTDVVEYGGIFTQNGYNGVIANGSNNPLANRQAWVRNSNGYVTSTLLLPSALQGQTVKFRFRMGSDEAATSQGWHVDNVSFSVKNITSLELQWIGSLNKWVIFNVQSGYSQ